MKELKIFLGKSQEILEDHDADTFGDISNSQFLSSLSQCPFLSHFSEESIFSLYNSLIKNLDKPLEEKWEKRIETCDMAACVAKVKEEGGEGEEGVREKVVKAGLVVQTEFESNVHLLAVFYVMNKAQSYV
jgi:hypothetical protein